ncbi:MAG: hypothetical protein H6Q04_3479, partial [Acidobacteria bacterium]|nr:hypothetical protein [Acidobacteriota bacterium]
MAIHTSGSKRCTGPFVAGHGAAADVPQEIKQSILLKIA